MVEETKLPDSLVKTRKLKAKFERYGALLMFNLLNVQTCYKTSDESPLLLYVFVIKRKSGNLLNGRRRRRYGKAIEKKKLKCYPRRFPNAEPMNEDKLLDFSTLSR